MTIYTKSINPKTYSKLKQSKEKNIALAKIYQHVYKKPAITINFKILIFSKYFITKGKNNKALKTTNNTVNIRPPNPLPF